MDETEALAICFQNLKGAKHKDLLATARALQFLKGLPGNDSNAKVGQAVGVSGEIVREFLTLLKLPSELQPLFEQHKLGLEQGRKLWQLTNSRPDILCQVALTLVRLSAMDSRGLIEYLLRHPDTTVAQAEKVIVQSRTVIEREFHVIALLSEEQYGRLEASAKKRGDTVDVLVTDIVQEWLESTNDTD